MHFNFIDVKKHASDTLLIYEAITFKTWYSKILVIIKSHFVAFLLSWR